MAAPLKLATATGSLGNVQALKDGAVIAQTCTVGFAEITPLINGFRRMVRALEFDVCEMPFGTYLCARAHNKPFTALPVFLVRAFHHGAIVCNTKSGLLTPRDLEGTRVGLNRGYTVTTGVWARGILQDEHGVDLSRVTWVLFGDEHVAEYRPPPNVIPAGQGKDIAQMLVTGELAAAIGTSVEHPDIAPLIAEPQRAGFEALRWRGLYPINHLIVVRDELLEKHPGLAADVFSAFAEAKNAYLSRLREGGIDKPSAADLTYKRVMDLVGDPLPYGVEPNRPMIEKFIDHAVRQQIVYERPRVQTLFHPSTLALKA